MDDAPGLRGLYSVVFESRGARNRRRRAELGHVLRQQGFRRRQGGYEYFLTSRGQLETVNFNYLTKSKRAEHAQTWPNYFGVSMEFAYGGGNDYHFPGKDRGKADYDTYWFALWLQERLYAQDTKKVRPYFNLAGGMGEGQIIAKGDDFDLGWTSLNLVRLKVGTGAEFMLSPKLGLDVGVDVNGTFGSIGSFFNQSDLAILGAEATIGISKWTEKERK